MKEYTTYEIVQIFQACTTILEVFTAASILKKYTDSPVWCVRQQSAMRYREFL